MALGGGVAKVVEAKVRAFYPLHLQQLIGNGHLAAPVLHHHNCFGHSHATRARGNAASLMKYEKKCDSLMLLYAKT